MKQWIDEKVEYLYQNIGRVPPYDFLFEPTRDFYEKLEKIELIPPLAEVLKNIDEDKPPYVTFSEATKDIAKHLGRNIPRIEFHPLERKIDGRNIAGQIQIGGQSRHSGSRTSSWYRRSGVMPMDGRGWQGNRWDREHLLNPGQVKDVNKTEIINYLEIGRVVLLKSRLRGNLNPNN